jgi:hypothetical protein
MFLGHFALGFAAKRAAPRTSLAALFAAAQFADLLWPILVATGIEVVRIDPGNTAFTPLDFVSYPYSHSLVMLLVWALAFGLVYRMATKRNGATFVVLAALVTSHWVLDFASHRPDVPIVPGGRKYGLGLWNSVDATLVIELALFAAGVWIYTTATRARDAQGRWGYVGLLAFMLVAYFGAAFGPPPPSVTALWITAIIGAAVLTAWAWWVDSHRLND